MSKLLRFSGPVWRLLPPTLMEAQTAPASAPEGRFHHSAQIAAYASLSAEGAGVAIQRYLDDGIPRHLVQMWLTADHVADERDNAAASVIWQDIRTTGAVSPTWRFSDRAREAGAEAMLYSSRSRPELTHVVIFDPDCLSEQPAQT